MTAIHQDAANDDDAADAANAFLQLWDADAEKPSDQSEAAKDVKTTEPPKRKKVVEQAEEPEETDDDADESDSDVQDEDGDEKESDEDDKDQDDEETILEDGLDKIKVKWKVEGQDREFTVKDLVRLAGQEAAITRKGQEVSDRRKVVDTFAETQTAGLERLIERARANFEPYSKIDFLKVTEELGRDQAAALHVAATRAWEDLQFLEKEMGSLTKDIQTRKSDEHVSAAKKCIEVLSDPTTGIEGWGETMYKDIVSYATKEGLPQELAFSLTEPAAFKLLHKAMLYDKGQAKVTIVKQESNKKSKAPKKIIKGTSSLKDEQAAAPTKKKQDAHSRLRKTGSVEDAAEALLAGWEREAD